MKKILSLIFLLFITTGVGCKNYKPTTTDSSSQLNTLNNNYSLNTNLVRIDQTEQSDFSDKPNYEQMLDDLNANFKSGRTVPTTAQIYGKNYSPDPIIYYNVAENSHSDCVGLYNRDTNGGDVLSSLIKDNIFRDIFSLKLYSKEYMQNLALKIDYYTKDIYNKSLFAYYVCNLQNGTDVVAGNLWPATKSPYYIDDNGRIKISDEFTKNRILILINKDRINELKTIGDYTGNATGGEIGPCDIKLNNEKLIEWKCFNELGIDENSATYGKYTNWILSLDGEILKTWKSTDR